MTAVYATLTARITCNSEAWHVPVTFSYHADDPVAVTMLIPSGCGTVAVWQFARSLLAEGMDTCAGDGDTCAGDGDVTVFWLGGDRLHIGLQRGDDRAVIEVERPAVRRFLRRSYTLIPPGDEYVDVDEAIEAIFAEAKS